MKLLLTSAGIKNASIEKALVDLLGKPIAESSALVIPTAAHPTGGPAAVWRIVSGHAKTPLCEVGWKSLGLLELTALPSIDVRHWLPMLRETDVLLVGGGDPLYLAHWLRQSGVADLLPALHDTVWVGVSGGSLVMAPHVGRDVVDWSTPDSSDEALGAVDFAMFPHLDHPDLPDNSMADAERWAATLSTPAYAIDDQTAITVVDGQVEVVSEGNWRLFNAQGVSLTGAGTGRGCRRARG